MAKQSRHGSRIQEMTCSVWLEFEVCGGAITRAEAGGQIDLDLFKHRHETACSELYFQGVLPLFGNL